MDTSRYWREVDKMDDIQYLYGDFSGESTLDKKIKNAEEILSQNKKLREEHLEEHFNAENLRRLQAMNPKDMTWQDVELYSEIKKRQANVGKAFDGSSLSDVPQSEGALPDTASLKSQIVDTANALIPMISSRGVAVQPIPQGSSLQDILAFCNSFRDALRNSQAPASGLEDPEEPDEPETVHKSAPKYTLEELKLTKIELNRMIAELEA